VEGVTGSCHQLHGCPMVRSVLVDCGLFQGAETSADGCGGAGSPEIDFSLDGVQALVVTHVHIDHVGRIPYLLAAGFKGPIVCSEASAELLPMVLEDALKVGVTRDEALIGACWRSCAADVAAALQGLADGACAGAPGLAAALVSRRGTSWARPMWSCTCRGGRRAAAARGVLGRPGRALHAAAAGTAPARCMPMWWCWKAPTATACTKPRRTRRQRLQALCEHAFANRGTLLVPAFSIGRTQELLYELEEIIHRNRERPAAAGVPWGEVDVVVDSPLAADFTAAMRSSRALGCRGAAQAGGRAGTRWPSSR
jgi:metallo-beta-lactamase family protein